MDGSASPWLRQQARPVRRLLTIGILAGSANALLMCGGAWLLAHLLSEAIFMGRGLNQLWPAIVALLVVAACRAVAGLLQQHYQADAGERVSATIQAELERSIRQRGPAWTARQSTGDLVTRLVDGVDALVPYYTGYLPQMCLSMIVPALVLLCVACAEPWSALVLLLAAPLLPVFMLLVGQAAAEASEKRWTRLRRLGARFMDALSGLTTLRLYGAAVREQALIAQAGDDYRRETMGVLRIAFLSALVLEFFATVSIAVIAVTIGFRLLGGSLGFESGMFALLLAPEFFAPLRAMGTQRHQRMEAIAAADSLLQIITPSNAPRPAVVSVHGSAKAQPPTIVLDDVCFAYAGDNVAAMHAADRPPQARPPQTGTRMPPRDAPSIDTASADTQQPAALTHIRLTVPAGTRLTLVGASGSGKSSLLGLLMGFHQPQQGRILVDGVDLNTLNLAAWRRQLMWVSQRPHVFHGSLRDNLKIARPDADEVTLRRAIQFAALEAAVARLPHGLDTPLGEQGIGLSGGEGQRLALARAWLRDAPLLLLDEPTQHLDRITAGKVNRALNELSQRRTVIRVAHRLNDVRDDDAIVVMAGGQVVEQGRAGDLRQQRGAYAGLLAAARSA